MSSTVRGIDQALWDIADHAHGVPVHVLLGGPVRDRIRVYAWAFGDEASEVADHARARIEAGFSAAKMAGTGPFGPIETPQAADAMIERVAALREVLGPARATWPSISTAGRPPSQLARAFTQVRPQIQAPRETHICGMQVMAAALLSWLRLIALDGDLARAEPKTLR